MTATGEMRKKVALFGKYLTLASVGASLRRYGPLELVTLDAEDPAAAEELRALTPDAVIFDLGTVAPDFSFSLLREQPNLLLIGLDAAGDKLLVLSGQQAHAVTTTDLVHVIETWPTPRPRPFWQPPLDRRLQVMTTLSKQTRFVEREEPKMKNLSKRNKTLLAIVGVVVVLVIAVLALTSVGGRGLFGTSGLIGTATFDIKPANPTVDQGATVQLCASGNARWESSNTSVVAIATGADKLIKCIDVKGMAKGEATITAHGSPYGVTSAQTNVKVK